MIFRDALSHGVEGIVIFRDALSHGVEESRVSGIR